MRYFFTSDFHLGHANIIKYCKRPFSSLEEMNNTIIKRFNERVKEDDLVYFLGDFCFKSKSGRGEGIGVNAGEWKTKLNCKNIIFIKGNHDRNNSLKTPIRRLTIDFGGHSINLVHKPDHADPHYKINFVGHCHEKWKFKRKRIGWQVTDLINVGVDVWDFYPRTFEEIMKEYYRWRKSQK